jgi:formate dehydrogenase iron-sulfur subunit
MASRETELSGLASGSNGAGTGPVGLLDRLVYPFRRGVPPPPRPATGFYTDTTVCIGCKACEVACKQWNQLPADGFHWTGNSYDNTADLSATSWRHVKFIEQFPEPSGQRQSLEVLPNHEPAQARWLMMSDVCKHCVNAPCQQACPTGAIVHNEFINVYIQADICNGCSYCVAACPFGVITRAAPFTLPSPAKGEDKVSGHAHKCTLCYDRQRDGLVPACAKACPTASIQFGPVDELRARARRRVEELHRRGVPGAYLYGDTATDTYSDLNSFYLLADRPSVYGLPEKPFNPWLTMKGDYVRALVGGLAGIAVLITLFLLGS